MDAHNPKIARGRILTTLYEHYLDDPLHMLTPAELLEACSVERTILAACAYYLYDRELIEMMIGYEPGMFAAVRISPSGIDAVEDRATFNRHFSAVLSTRETDQVRALESVMTMVGEAEQSPLEGVRLEWLLGDIRALRDDLRQLPETWDPRALDAKIRWVEDYFEKGAEMKQLPSLGTLKSLLAERVEAAQTSQADTMPLEDHNNGRT